MTWKPIVVGVDGSPESVRAAVVGAAVAQAGGADCHLLHAVPDYAAEAVLPELADVGALHRAACEHARELIKNALEPQVPQALIRTLDVCVGRAPLVLTERAHELQAELIVVGGKRPRGLARLFGGTIPHLVRTCDVPIMASDGGSGDVGRVLAAVDLSHAAQPTIAAAERYARLFGARLRVLHVAEPLTVVPGFAQRPGEDETFRAAERALDATVWPLIEYPGAETVVRRGRSAAGIVAEVGEWRADLVVVGSHGKGWVDRLLIGSTSERLLSVLPTLTLVVPVGRPSSSAAPQAAGAQSWEGRR